MRAAISEQYHEDLGPRTGDLGPRLKCLLRHPMFEVTRHYGSHRLFLSSTHHIIISVSRSLSPSLSVTLSMFIYIQIYTQNIIANVNMHICQYVCQ